jgi:hypothetical protein
MNREANKETEVGVLMKSTKFGCSTIVLQFS